MFRKMPILLLAIICCMAVLDPYLPLPIKSFLYSLSLTLKSLIIFVLPAVIFMLLFKTLSQFAGKATKILILILSAVVLSNFLSTMISCQIGKTLFFFDLSLHLPIEAEGLQPLWSFTLFKWIGNDVAMFGGLSIGVLLSLFRPLLAEKISLVFDKVLKRILRSIFFAIPLFIAGFVVKLTHDKLMDSILKDYFFIFAIVAIAQFVYIAGIYWICSRCKGAEFIHSVKNILPASIAGFGSMSSAAAMPLTLMGAEKNAPGSNLPKLAIPTTVNVHLIGDCFAIPIFAFAVMKSFGMQEPSLIAYLTFALYFVLAKFSVAAVPGGGIIVMLPILENTLGFTPEMASLITALYILFDPVITCANVSGNGAFALAMSKIEKRVFKKMA
jgi:hypothetical protein